MLTALLSKAQIHEPVSWKTDVEKISDTEYNLIITATIEDNWHLYSQKLPKKGPSPTTFSFEESKDYKLVGTTKEGEGEEVFDEAFKMKLKYFSNKAEFKQKIKLLSEQATITGVVEFMVCDDSQCLPPTEVDLTFQVPAGSKAKPSKINAIITTDNNGENTKIEAKADHEAPTEKKSSSRGLLTIFLLAFGGGLVALLTPCVFPMIPMTVSFFTKQSKNKRVGVRNAIIYGLSIIVIYVILGTVVTAIFGADALNGIASSIWFNLIFFLLLIIFAISFLGAFELTLPSSWGTKVDSQADKGGLVGIFFMALALAIVSFSCTAPIVGTLLVEAASKGGITPIIGMLGFSLALAIPFAVFAAFPGWLNSLPKSGGWLNTVKVVLGFLELAFAFKFLSNADLALQLHLLEREVFIAIWIAVFGTLALYLFGKIRLPHDSPLTHISVGRLSLGLITLTFTLYLIPGLWGAPLNLISAFPPPQHYSESQYGVGYTKLAEAGVMQTQGELPEGGHFLEPHNILSFDDYEKGLAYAKKVGKPVLIDFTGWTCVNCRKMEQNVWPKANILEILKNKVVLISLYVDDKRPLEEGEIVDSQLRPGKKLKYIGQKWSEFQTVRYKANSQPFYVLMNHDETNLITPIGYTPDADDFYSWLKKGVESFKK